MLRVQEMFALLRHFATDTRPPRVLPIRGIYRGANPNAADIIADPGIVIV